VRPPVPSVLPPRLSTRGPAAQVEEARREQAAQAEETRLGSEREHATLAAKLLAEQEAALATRAAEYAAELARRDAEQDARAARTHELLLSRDGDVSDLESRLAAVQEGVESQVRAICEAFGAAVPACHGVITQLAGRGVITQLAGPLTGLAGRGLAYGVVRRRRRRW
jgi:hypothetical protein